jgi:hypothetical protein
MFLPKRGARLFDLNFNSPWKNTIAGGPHFWEVRYSAAYSCTAIVKRLKQRYGNVCSGRFALKPIICGLFANEAPYGHRPTQFIKPALV